MSDKKFFARGKVQELREELNSDKDDKKHSMKRTALKKIVANLTMGNDMGALFPDVVACMQIGDIAIKKMVYLYLINYARHKPDMVILAVNSFLKDAADSNPLIRALAIRTMSYINVDKVTDCICEPLRNCLKDKDPYVRKTAALAVTKLYFHDQELVKNQGLLTNLKDLVNDSNPTVVANALIGLLEIHEKSPDFQFSLDMNAASNLATALNECSEWAQTYILEAMMFVKPGDSADAESLIERVLPRMQHANSGVVLASVKVLVYLAELVSNKDYVRTIYSRLAPPLVTLLSCEPEIQYVALRNILLVVEKQPDLLKKDIRVFFCKYNDPIYVKLSKLDVLFKLVTESNVDLLLSELKEYSSEVDVEFVRKAVRAIGRCAIKIESAADKCIQALVELIQTKVNYVVQESIVVIKDVFRKYPDQYESIIAVLCENLDSLDEPEAKSSMIWIIGHYADRIDNSDELLDSFLDSFLEEPAEVQLSMLTAVVKLFIKNPSGGKVLVPKVLKWATEEVDNPDVRDRGYIYWRLLSTDPIAAKSIVFPSNTTINAGADRFDQKLLDELLSQIDTLGSIYHRPARMLAPHLKFRQSTANNNNDNGSFNPPASRVSAGFDNTLQQSQKVQQQHKMKSMNLLDIDEPEDSQDSQQSYQQQPQYNNHTQQQSQMIAPPVQQNGLSSQMSGLGLGSREVLDLGLVTDSFVPVKVQFLAAAQGKGLEIHGTFARRQKAMFMDLTIQNKALQPIGDIVLQFNKNSFAIVPAGGINIRNPLPPNSSAETTLALAISPTTHFTLNDPINNLHVAIKASTGLFFFFTKIPMHILLVEDGLLVQADFLRNWKEHVTSATSSMVDQIQFPSVEALRNKLSANNIFTVAERVIDNKGMLYCSSKLVNDTVVLMEVQAQVNNGQQVVSCMLTARSSNAAYHNAYLAAISDILRNAK
ncbi:hypothetical protein MP228_009281 [Amoeboaphelidium protococcarum]|nr:hypothetical protein MP228_009281 [Amoeboaphelidium protococcarum]